MKIQDINWEDGDSQTLRRKSDGTEWTACTYLDGSTYFFVRTVKLEGGNTDTEYLPSLHHEYDLLEFACILTEFEPTITEEGNHDQSQAEV